MLDLLTEYGIDPQMIFTGSIDDRVSVLVDLRKVFVSQVDSLKGSNDFSSEEMSVHVANAKRNPEAIATAKNFMSEVNALWIPMLSPFMDDGETTNPDYCPDAIIILVDEVTELLSQFKYEAKEYLGTDGKDDAELVTERKSKEEKYEAADKLRDLMLTLYSLVKDSLPFYVRIDDDGEITEDESYPLVQNPIFAKDGAFAVKDSTNNGVVPDLPRMPDKPGSKKKGRTSVDSKRRFIIVNDDVETELPVGITGPEVARNHLSNETVHVSWNDVKSAVKALDPPKDFMKDDWEVSFDTGTLRAFTVKKEAKADK